MKALKALVIFLCIIILIRYQMSEKKATEAANKEVITAQQQEFAEITNQTEVDLPMKINVGNDSVMLYPPKGAYWVDFSNEKTKSLEQSLKKNLSTTIGMELVAAFVYPADKPYLTSSCGGVGRSRNCSTMQFVPGNMGQVCYLAQSTLINTMLLDDKALDLKTRQQVAEVYMAEESKSLLSNTDPLYDVEVLANEKDYIVAYIKPKNVGMAEHLGQIISKVILKGKIFSAACSDNRTITIGLPVYPNGWEARTLMEWMKHLVEVNNQTPQTKTN